MQGSCRWHQNPRGHGSQASGRTVRLKKNKWVKWYIGTSSKKKYLHGLCAVNKECCSNLKKLIIFSHVCVCVHRCGHKSVSRSMIVGPQSWYRVSSMIFPHFTYWNKLYRWTQRSPILGSISRLLAQKMPGLCTWAQQLKVGHIPIWCSYGCQDQLQSLCFHEDRFIYWAISAVPDLIKSFKQLY